MGENKQEFDGWHSDIQSNNIEKIPVRNEVLPSEVEKKTIVNNQPMTHVLPSTRINKLGKRPPIGENIKILLYGGAGTGKTRTALLYFKQLWMQDNTIRCKVFDTDKGTTEVLQEVINKNEKLFPDKLVDNIDWYNCTDFNSTLEAMKEVFAETTKKDVIIFDMLDKLYEDAQEKYTEDVFGEDLANYVIFKRQELSKSKKTQGMGAFEGWTDWVAIKLLHNRGIMNRITKEIGCHVVCITSSKEIESDDPEHGKIVKNPDIFTKVGFSPVGERRNPYRFDRIYHFMIGSEGWYYIAVKKRGGDIYKKIQIKKGEYPEL